jgi:HK97 family phage major capsid protein
MAVCRSAFFQTNPNQPSRREEDMNLTAMRQKLADLKAKGDGILKAADGRDLTDAERLEFDANLAAINTAQGDIKRLEAMADLERSAPTVPATGTTSASVGHNNAADRPFESLGEQLKAVAAAAVAQKVGGSIDPRLMASASGANEAVDAEGGFLVRPEFADGILERTYEEGLVTSRCQTIPMASNRLVLNALDEDSRAAGQRYGGIQVFRAAEAAAYTASQPKFKQLTLTANKLIGLMYATDEILEDTAALASWASKNFPKAFAFQNDDEAINGTGSGQMLGVLNSGAAVQQAAEGGQASTTIVTNNILKMFQRLWAPSRKNAVWFINQDVEQQLYSLTLGTGTAVELLYTPPGMKGNNNDYGLLMGKPVLPIEQCATLGTVGDIILADMTQYLLGQKSGLKADSSIHVQFLTGQQVFRWSLRNDAQPIWKKPLTPYKGTNTVSSFVTLATR